jgi:hypothetical protein
MYSARLAALSSATQDAVTAVGDRYELYRGASASHADSAERWRGAVAAFEMLGDAADGGSMRPYGGRPMSIRIARGTVGLALIVSCALATPDTGLAAWSPPQAAATTYGDYQHIVLDSNAVGDVVIAWERDLEDESPGCVESVMREGPTAWTHPALLSREGEYLYAGSVGAGINEGGEAIVTWVSPSGEIHAAGRAPASAWRGLGPVAASEETTYGTQLLAGADAHTKIVFLVSSHRGRGQVRAERVRTVSVGAAGRGVTRTIYSHRSEFFPRYLRVATDERGETFLAWVDEGRAETVQALVLAANGKPEGPVQAFPKRRGRIEELQVKTNEQGDALLAWRRQAPGRLGGIDVATRSHGGRFSRAARISRTSDDELTSAVEPDAQMTLLFTHRLGDKATAVEIISNSGSGWTAQKPVAPSPRSTSTYGPQLASNPITDELVAIWSTAPTEAPGPPIAVSVPARDHLPPNACAAKPVPYTPEPEAATNRIEASTQVGGGSWQPAVVLSRGGRPVALTISPAGIAIAAWTKESAQRETIYVSQYEPST